MIKEMKFDDEEEEEEEVKEEFVKKLIGLSYEDSVEVKLEDLEDL